MILLELDLKEAEGLIAGPDHPSHESASEKLEQAVKVEKGDCGEYSTERSE